MESWTITLSRFDGYMNNRIKAILDIELERPRTSEIIASQGFGRFVGQIWMLLREESLKGFKQAKRKGEGWSQNNLKQ